MAEEAALRLDVNADGLAVVVTRGRRWVECLVLAVGLTTACMSVASAIYKAPSGIFNGHSCAYYASVVSAGLFGLAEVCAAVFWLSYISKDDDRRQGGWQYLWRRCVLCAAFVPLVYMAGVGGLRMLVK